MIGGWAVVLSALVYLCFLFAIAHWGDHSGSRLMRGPARGTIYALALAVYCTSWTFFGSVGLASRSGLDFLTIYIGPVLVIGLGHRLVERVVRIAKAQNITSIADFVAARYGKSERVAAIVCVIAVVGAVPYIALQLKAVSASLNVFLAAAEGGVIGRPVPVFGDLALVVALVLAGFAVAFGTRHTDATEHQDGLMLAIALESVVKLVAFLVVGAYVAFWMFGGLDEITSRLTERRGDFEFFARTSEPGSFVTLTLLAGCAALLLPRQFHMAVVENRGVEDVRRLAWLFPLYLVLINIFVIPLALAGLATFAPGEIDRDMTVLGLPLKDGAGHVALVAFLGGLSAATAMVIVETVAVAIMISNHLVVPIVLRRRGPGDAAEGKPLPVSDLGGFVIGVRRVAIFVVTLLGYAYYRAAGDAGLAAIGLLSFAAVAQVAPAFFGGLFWSRGTALGASAGLAIGFAIWGYTLLLPSLALEGVFWTGFVKQGPFGLALLKPTALMGLELPQLTHGVLWSLALNLLAYVAFSLLRPANAVERLQATAFVGTDDASVAPSFRLFRASVSVDDLRATVARYLGEERTNRSFESFAKGRGGVLDGRSEADIHLLRYAGHLLASAIGAAAIQYSRELLQHALDHARQGITVLDRELRLLAWNRAFIDLYELPPEFVRIGVGLDEIIRLNAERGSYGPGAVEDVAAERIHSFVHDTEPQRVRLHPTGRVIEVRTNKLPGGGFVTTYTDATETVGAGGARKRANELLEQRVRERTEELPRLNAALLYATSLVERDRDAGDSGLAENVDASLDAVEEILTALLDLSRLDTGAMKPQWTSFRIDEMFRQLQLEFDPIAGERRLAITFVPTALTVRSDRRLLRRLLQNLISNAIKYTPSGRVLVGARRRGDRVSLQVWDTGLGIPASKQKLVFHEFQRLDQGAKVARGLGLSIVERVARVLDHPIALSSEPGRGSVFRVEVPIAAAQAPSVVAIRKPRGPATPLAGLTVLAIDNEPSILEGMRALLTGWGCEVITAASLDAAREAMARRLPEVIVADYHLDEGNGLQAVAALRRAYAAEIPAVLVTADRSPAVREAAAAATVHVLNKPLKPAALRALLAQWRATRVAAE